MFNRLALQNNYMMHEKVQKYFAANASKYKYDRDQNVWIITPV